MVILNAALWLIVNQFSLFGYSKVNDSIEQLAYMVVEAIIRAARSHNSRSCPRRTRLYSQGGEA